MPFIVPSQGVVGNDQIVNQLLQASAVAFNSFGDSGLYSCLSYLKADYDTDLGTWATATDLSLGAVSQPFTTGGAANFKGVEVFPTIIGDDRATLVVQLFATSSGSPTGNALQEVHVPAAVINAKATAMVNPTIGIFGPQGTPPTDSTQAGSSTVVSPSALVVHNPSGAGSITSYPLAAGLGPDVGGVPTFAGLGSGDPQANYPVDLLGTTYASFNSTIYGVGGASISTGYTTDAIYTAAVDGFGNIGSWSAATALPVDTQLAGVCIAPSSDGRNWLLVVGGQHVDAFTSVYTNQVHWIEISSNGSMTGSWTTQHLENAILDEFITSELKIRAINCNGQVLVGSYDLDNIFSPGITYPLYLLNNQLPDAVGLQAISLQTGYGVLSADTLSTAWTSTSGQLFGLSKEYSVAGQYYNGITPGFIFKANEPGSASWASNPYPTLGFIQNPTAHPTSPVLAGILLNAEDGQYGVIAPGVSTYWGQQVEAFRIPFHYALSAATTYAVVFSLLDSAGTVGPGSSIGLTLGQVASSTNAARQYDGGWVNLTSDLGYANVSGFFFDTVTPQTINYAGFVDATATIVPRWDVVYWNQWSQTPECIVSVAGQTSEILFPQTNQGAVQSS